MKQHSLQVPPRKRANFLHRGMGLHSEYSSCPFEEMEHFSKSKRTLIQRRNHVVILPVSPAGFSAQQFLYIDIWNKSPCMEKETRLILAFMIKIRGYFTIYFSLKG